MPVCGRFWSRGQLTHPRQKILSLSSHERSWQDPPDLPNCHTQLPVWSWTPTSSCLSFNPARPKNTDQPVQVRVLHFQTFLTINYTIVIFQGVFVIERQQKKFWGQKNILKQPNQGKTVWLSYRPCWIMDSKLRTKPKALFGGFKGLSKAPGSRCTIFTIWGGWSPLQNHVSGEFHTFFYFLGIFQPFSDLSGIFQHLNIPLTFSKFILVSNIPFWQIKKLKQKVKLHLTFFGHRSSLTGGINFRLVGPLKNISFDLKLFLLSS